MWIVFGVVAAFYFIACMIQSITDKKEKEKIERRRQQQQAEKDDQEKKSIEKQYFHLFDKRISVNADNVKDIKNSIDDKVIKLEEETIQRVFSCGREDFLRHSIFVNLHGNKSYETMERIFIHDNTLYYAPYYGGKNNREVLWMLFSSYFENESADSVVKKFEDYLLSFKNIPLDRLKYYKEEGTIQYTNQTEIHTVGGGINKAGAIKGGILFGAPGAVIGSRSQPQIYSTNEEIKHDTRGFFLLIDGPKGIERFDSKSGLEGLDKLRSLIPEKEYEYVIANEK